MKNFFTAPLALALLAISLSGCVWWHHGYYDHGGYYHGGGGGYDHGGYDH